MITENVSTLKINKLTQKQYDRALAAGNINANEIYLTPAPLPEDGFSPSVSVEQTENGATISITDKDGTKTAEITNGNDYVLTESDKQEIADMIPIPDIPESGGGGNSVPKLLYDKTFENPNSITDTIEGLSDCNYIYFQFVIKNGDAKSKLIYTFYCGGELYIYNQNLPYAVAAYNTVSIIGEIAKIGEKSDETKGWYVTGTATSPASGSNRISSITNNFVHFAKKLGSTNNGFSLKMSGDQVVDSITIRIWGC